MEVAKLIRKAPHVHVAGFRSCYPVAFGMVYGYRLFRSSVSLISAEAGTLEMQLRGIDTYKEFIERHQRAMEKPDE